jgi:hypothetical protein
LSSRALIIGIDAYERVPLTSAVNDAVAFHSALLELGVVESADTTLLTSPQVDGAASEATFDAITSVLEGLYFDGDEVERLIVYFAGHGLLAFSDPAMSQSGTALMPVDVTNVERNARRLIHLGELLGYMRLAGPQEQLLFIDACRDLPYTRHPAWTGLGWGNRAPGAARRQAVLYAVSELGQSVGIPGSHGRMTRRLIEALRGNGSALDYDLERDAYVITMQSVRNYVRAKLAADLDTALVDFGFALPSLDAQDPLPGPIRELPTPPPRALTVHIEPESAATAATVRIGLGGSVILESWPPCANHATVMLDPRPHRLTATASSGTAEPANCLVDVREQDEAVVRIHSTRRTPESGSRPRVRSQSTGSAAENGTRGRVDDPDAPRDTPSNDGRLRVAARDPAVAIDVVGLEPPYRFHTALGYLDFEVPPGAYRIDFRFGLEALSSTQVYVAAEEEVLVSAPEGADFARRAPGPQLSAAQWQLLGLAPFMGDDAPAELAPAVSPLRARARELRRPVAIVVESANSRVEIASVPVALVPVETPYGSVAIALGEGRRESFDVRVRDTRGTAISIASATLEDRVTVLTQRRRAAGQLDVTQNLLPRPERPRLPYDPAPELVDMVKLLQTGQQLYKSGELLRASTSHDVITLLYGKWTDPVFGCMGIYAAQQSSPDDFIRHTLGQAAHNLVHFFGDLPDARIAASLVQHERRAALLLPLLAGDAVPLLAHSAALLARFATEVGELGHPAIDRYARIFDGQPWNLRLLAMEAR